MMGTTTNTDTTDPFVSIGLENYGRIHSILEERLPRSSNLYNTFVMQRTMGSKVKMYTYAGDFSPSSWILFIVCREDYGNDISISVPINPVITDAIKSAFTTSEIFDWDKPYLFAGIDAAISPMIIEISTLVKLNALKVSPNIYYYMDREYASKICIEKPDGVEMKDIAHEDGVDFFLNNWKHSTEGTREYIQRAIDTFPALGLYKKDEIVSGVLLNLNGFIGILYTLSKCRGEGLAATCMRSMAKKVAAQGMVPTSSSAHENFASKEFHRKIGMKVSHECVFISHDMSKW